MDIKEKSLKLALEAAACRELPKAYRDGMGFWIKAIVLVRKRNMTQSYALAERRADGVIRYVKDYGLMSQIEGLVSVHPYVYFDEARFMQPFKSEAAQRRVLLSFFGSGREDEINAADAARLEVMTREMGIKMQLMNNPLDVEANAIAEGVVAAAQDDGGVETVITAREQARMQRGRKSDKKQ